MSSKPNVPKKCNICGSLNAFLNYGAVSCRACGAFFRRFVLFGPNYECICKNESQKSGLSYTIGCKYCRVKKCIENGMKKELVRSTYLRNFHEERRQIMEKKKELATLNRPNLNQIKSAENVNIRFENFGIHQNNEAYLVQMLMGLHEKAEMLRKYINIIPMEFFEKFASLESLLIANKNNLLANPQPKQNERNNSEIPLDPSHYVVEIRKNGIFFGVIPILVNDLWIFVNFARAMPIFNRLQFEDRIIVLKNSTFASLLMFDNFYSAKNNSETLISYEGFSIYPIYAFQYPDKILLNAAAKIFHIPTQEFLRIKLAKDEFVLLMALLFTNSAIPGLSPQGQQILKGEEEKYGKMLLGLQQRRFGENAGALRYMETLRLLWTTIRQMQKHHEIATYIDSVYENGKYEKIVPKALFPMLRQS